MKLNNKGWGLGTLIAGVGVFAIALLIVVIIVNKNLKELGLMNDNINDKKYDYTILEKKVEDSAIKYIDKKNIEEDTTLTITIKKLEQEKYLKEMKELKSKKCSGYVVVTNKNNDLNYDSYLKCNNYITLGYDKRFDN